ncbi:MAG: hypothetical protein EBR71_01465 [Planctomycetes bacterium]|nr:hypothetical protein [Planctomycetota bacterium]
MCTRMRHAKVTSMERLSWVLQVCVVACLSTTVFAQWEQCVGTANLNMQSLLTEGAYNFAGGATGAYLSTDQAAHYVTSNTGNDATGPTRGFAKDGTYVYTCTSKGVFRSADHGATWIARSTGLTNQLTSGILSVDSYLFVVTPTGVFKSTNHGDTWSSSGLSSIDVRSIAAIRGVLVAGTNGSGAYRSVDWGSTWTACNSGSTSTTYRAMESDGTTLFAGGQVGTGVYRSTNLGQSWTLLSGGLPSGSYRGFASRPGVIVAGSFGAGVFYSKDDGDHWTALNDGLTDLSIYDLEFNDAYLVVATNTKGAFRIPLSVLGLCPSDLDGDGAVGSSDIAFVLLSFGDAAPGDPADVDGSGSVDAADVSLLLLDFGPCA